MGLLLHADLLKAELDSIEGVAVHVDRKFDVREQATAELGKKTTGAFLSISLGGWSPMNPDASATQEYWATLRYEISFVTMPHLLEAREMPSFDTLLEQIITTIHGWVPDGINAAYCPDMRWRVGAGSFVPDDDFLVYLFVATFGEDFANPVTAP